MLKRIIIGLLVALSLLGNPQRGATEELIITPQPLKLEQYIQQIFGEKAAIALAVFKHESHLNLKQKNYNCRYYTSAGKKYSTSCKTIDDRVDAWSVDCGIAQINVRGKVCPASLLTLKGNMNAVAKKYREEGLEAWVSYTSGAYKKFL